MPLHFPYFDAHFDRDDWTLPRVLEYQAECRPNDVFLCWGHDGPQWTFCELNRQVNRLAHGLSARGIGKGDHVALFLPNCPEFVLAWFALGKIGAVELALSDAYKAEFLLHPLRLSGAKWMITDSTLATRVAEYADSLDELEYLVFVGGAEIPPALCTAMKSFTLHTFDALHLDRDDNPAVEVSPEDPAAVLMTSGTTGPSKGVVMRHSQLYFFAEEDVQLTRLTADDTYMTGFPLFHGNAQFLTVYPCLIAGARCVLYPRFSASKWSERAHLSGATVTNLLGATMSFIMDALPTSHDNAHALRCIYAAPLATDLAEGFTLRFGVADFVDGFGQTEISNIFMTPPDTPRPSGACGALVDQWFEIRLVDPDTGEDAPEGESGELWVRPKATGIVAYEYLGMPEKTVEAWRDLWFHTGDAMKCDAQGWYYFVDRIKDALRRRGENISSFEVERAVLSHPRIAQCAVVGVRADEKAGEDEVLAYVVPEGPGDLDYEDLIDHCERLLPNFMVPRYVEVLASLPLTATEKVKKKDLRARGIGDATWDRNKHPGSRKAG